MDPAEIPHRVDPLPYSPPFVVGKRLRQSAMPVDPVCKVLGDDDLLIEILLLIGYPATLVRAALVCKRWYCHASDPAFLRRFRKLHPPRLLGFYVKTGTLGVAGIRSRFVPMLPQPPEFDAVIRRASSSLDACSKTHKVILDCRNGNVFIHEAGRGHIVLSPLCPERGMVIIPRFPDDKHKESGLCTLSRLLFKEEGDGLSYFYVCMESSKEGAKSTVHVYMLQDGVWCLHTSATTQLPCLPHKPIPLLVGNKIYMAATMSEILVWDFTTLSFSTIQLPQGLVLGDRATILLRADDDSGVYLIHLNKLLLRIWLHTGDNWLLLDTICLREMSAKLRMSYHTDAVWLNQVGRNAEFVFMQMGRCLLYLSIKCRMLCKVYEMASEDEWLGRVYPFMMMWPPKFPALKDASASNAT